MKKVLTVTMDGKRLGKQKCHHSFSLAEFPLHHGPGSEKP